jgi:hypothetical protein
VPKDWADKYKGKFDQGWHKLRGETFARQKALAASFSALGVRQGPPNALAEPNPASSIRMIRIFGAPFGERDCSIGGNLLSGSFAS